MELNSDALKAARLAFEEWIGKPHKISKGDDVEVELAWEAWQAALDALPKQDSEVSKLTEFLNTISVGRPTKEAEACETAIMLIKHLRLPKQEPVDLDTLVQQAQQILRVCSFRDEAARLRFLFSAMGLPKQERSEQPNHVLCKECNGTGRTDNHVNGEVECSSCDGTGFDLEMVLEDNAVMRAQVRAYKRELRQANLPKQEGVNKCADCGREMPKSEGGTVFTVCDACWDKNPGYTLRMPKQEPSERQIVLSLTGDDPTKGKCECKVVGLSLFEVLGMLRYYHRKFETDAIISHREITTPIAQPLPDPPKGDEG